MGKDLAPVKQNIDKEFVLNLKYQIQDCFVEAGKIN